MSRRVDLTFTSDTLSIGASGWSFFSFWFCCDETMRWIYVNSKNKKISIKLKKIFWISKQFDNFFFTAASDSRKQNEDMPVCSIMKFTISDIAIDSLISCCGLTIITKKIQTTQMFSCCNWDICAVGQPIHQTQQRGGSGRKNIFFLKVFSLS